MKGLQLIINPGSSNVKIEIFMEKKSVFKEKRESTPQEIVSQLKDLLTHEDVQKLLLAHPLRKIAVRVVHGGDHFKKPTKANKATIKKLKTLDSLAPLHNPPARKVIISLLKTFPRIPVWMIFDTSFHQTLSPVHQHYAIPPELTHKYKIKRYGFHGIACSSIMSQLKGLVRSKKKTIICHLGGGCSVTAVKQGKSFMTSMGYTPLEGLIMGSRSGDLDPGILLMLMKKGMKPEKIEDILQNESGLKALAGTTDFREILTKTALGNKRASKAFHLFCARAAEYIARYSILMEGVDQIIFSGGIGENSPELREHVCELLKPLGIRMNRKKNLTRPAKRQLQSVRSRTQIMWMHADEASEMNRIILTLR